MSRKVFEGTVASTKMQKTLVVVVTRWYREGKIGKIISSKKRYKVHCENSAIVLGDLVTFEECQPLSRDKKFRFLKLVRKGDTALLSALD